MMKTKTYYSKELSTALEQIKNELGADAAIVRSRKTRRPGLRGLFSKPVYEIVVSYDPEDMLRQKKKERPYKLPLTEPVPLGAKRKEPKISLKPNSEIVQMAAQAAEAAETAKNDTVPETKKTDKGGNRPAADEEPLLDDRFLEEEAEDVLTEAMYTKEDLEIASLLRDNPVKTEESPYNKRLSAYQIMQSMAENSMTGAQKQKQPAQSAAIPAKAEAPKPPEPEQFPKLDAVKPRRGAVKKNDKPAREENTDDMEIVQGTVKPEMDARLESMEKMLQTLAADMKKMSQGEEPPEEEEAEDNAAEEEKNPGLESLKLRLLDQDVDARAVDSLMESAREAMKKNENLSPAGAMRAALREMLGRPKYLQGSGKGTRVIMLMGPTGVGKTTTVAKIAAECVFNRHAKVAIVNADVFRVGAQEQLETYANILGAAFRTIHNAEELRSAIEDFSNCQYIFVDTGGRASMDKKYQDELSGMINTGVMHEIYLVTSSTTSSRICRQIAQNYSFAKRYKNIITKLDEAGSYGNAVTLCYYGKQPLSYFTIGQNVPEDIRRADLDVVIDMLLRISR